MSIQVEISSNTKKIPRDTNKQKKGILKTMKIEKKDKLAHFIFLFLLSNAAENEL
jgi:hypothetical protein